jgi:hypothetical protein
LLALASLPHPHTASKTPPRTAPTTAYRTSPRPQDLAFSRPFSLTAQREGRVSALLAYFDAAFTARGAPPGGEAVVLTTHPLAPATGWLQTLFSFPRALQVGTGCLGGLEGRMTPAGGGNARGAARRV